MCSHVPDDQQDADVARQSDINELNNTAKLWVQYYVNPDFQKNIKIS